MAEGDIGAVIDTLEFDTDNGLQPHIIHISGDTYAIAYRGPDDDGFVITVPIQGDGTIGGIIDTCEFEGTLCTSPRIIHISGDTYAIAYTGPVAVGRLITLTIASDGQITSPTNLLDFDATGVTPDIIHVSGNVYAIAYQGPDTDGWLVTVTIESDGTIGAIIETFEYLDGGTAQFPKIRHVSGDVYAIFYSYAGSAPHVSTLTIDSAGNIGAIIDTSTVGYTYPSPIRIAGDVWALAFTGVGDDGWLQTLTIQTGQITDGIDSFEFDPVQGMRCEIIHISGDVYAIAYMGPDADGWLVTVTIESDGQIAEPVIDSLEFDSSNCNYLSFIHIFGNTYAIAYTGPDSDGFLKTMDIETVVVTGRAGLTPVLMEVILA